MNRPTYDSDSIARDAAVIYATAIYATSAGRVTGVRTADCIADALELHRLAWEACLPLNRPAPSPTHGPGAPDPIVAGLRRMEQELRDLGVRPVTDDAGQEEDDDGA